MYNRKIKAYTVRSLEADMATADPHRVIQLMMQSFLERIAQAKGAIERNDMEAKSIAVSKAQGVLHGLQDALDMSQGRMAEDLYGLYAYMDERVWDASLNRDTAPLDEVMALMLTIKSGWDQLPETEKNQGYQMRQQLGEL